tara:strand:+ start:137 stop:529 length:393 start_codon:yes stop_codon:yes gene_type:complete
MIVKIPASIGELVDKITILEIKKIKIKNKGKLKNINKEYKYLKIILRKKVKMNKKIKDEIKKLKKINSKLWRIEDSKRLAEKNKKFDAEFIKNARNVYIYNDRRANIKSNINNLTGSQIVEEKSYSDHDK